MYQDDEVLRRRIGDADLVREAFEDVPVMVAAMEGPELRFVAANAAYRALAGSSEFIGRPLRDVFPEFAGQQVVEMVERVFTSGEPYVMNEWRMQFSSGDEMMELFLDVHLVPRFTADLEVHGVVGYIIDVTERAKTRLAAQAEAAEVGRRYERARDVISALQRELLPPGLPVLPQVRVAGSYLLADADTAAGGDWFDALSLPDGRLGLVVGDVIGHGVAASAVMAQLRTVVAERLLTGVAIPEVLAAADRYAGQVRGARAATLGVAVLDPSDGTLSYCTAGHPPPLLLPARGEAQYLPVTGAGPLGVDAAFPVRTAHLDPDDLVLLYTDGIIERPGREVRTGTVELAKVASDAAAGRALRTAETSPVERVCTQTLELLVRATGHTDDITLLAVQRVEPKPRLELTLPAQVSAVAASRAAATVWLRTAEAGDDDVFAVLHALGEWVSNAVEHAYPPHLPAGTAVEDTVTVRAQVAADGRLRIEVTDRGSWRADAAAAGRGRGLAMSRGLMDEVRVDGGPGGTTVVATRRLTRPARLLTAEEITSGSRSPAARTGEQTVLHITERPGLDAAAILAEGPVDTATAPQLHEALQRRRRAGTRALAVDLSGVTHLASAGVAVLFDIVRDAGATTQVKLYAPIGSVADQVLEMVGLPHTNRAAHIRPD